MTETDAARPFRGRIVRPEHASRTVTAPERETRRDILAGGAFDDPAGPVAVLYRVERGEARHSGLIVEVPVAAYASGRVRPHEEVRGAKTERFAAILRETALMSTPALLVHPPHPGLASLRAEIGSGEPHVRVHPGGDERHSIWVTGDPGVVARLGELLGELGDLYVVDGHHRLEAARRAPVGSVLASVTDAGEVEVRAFHRLVGDVEETARRALRRWLEETGAERVGGRPPLRPDRAGEVLAHVDGRWWRARLRPGDGDRSPTSRLDPVLLQEQVLGPLLGVRDPSVDPRLEFVPDDLGRDRIEERSRADGGTVGFLIHPPTVDDVLAVADAGETMPPKSTWFWPKLASGLVCLELA